MVISLKHLCKLELYLPGQIMAEAGVTNQQLVRFSADNELDRH